MQGKQVGYQAVRQGTNPDYPTTNLWIVSIANLKHTSVMAKTWSTTLPKAKRKWHVGGNLVEIDYSEYMHYNYFGCHAIDDNNNNCQGQLSFEETFTPNQWELHHLGWIVALVQINSLLGYNIFNHKTHHEDFITKAEFTRDLVDGLICTEDNQEEEIGLDGYSLPHTCGHNPLPHGAWFNYSNDPCPFSGHSLCKINKHHGIWNGKVFPKIKCMYSKANRKDCGRDIQTFCYCSWSYMMCFQCHRTHLASVEAKE